MRKWSQFAVGNKKVIMIKHAFRGKEEYRQGPMMKVRMVVLDRGSICNCKEARERRERRDPGRLQYCIVKEGIKVKGGKKDCDREDAQLGLHLSVMFNQMAPVCDIW